MKTKKKRDICLNCVLSFCSMESESAKMFCFLALAVEEQSILCSMGCLKPAESTVAKKRKDKWGKIENRPKIFCCCCLSSLVSHIASILILNAPL